MKYYTFHIKDSGAIEDFDEIVVNGENTLTGNIYDDNEFNKLNDILHSISDYIMNESTLKIFSESKLISYELRPIIIKRKELKMGFIKVTNKYKYFQLKIQEPKDLHCYKWINFKKSDIQVRVGDIEYGFLQSHEELLDMIDKNKKTSSEINRIYKLDISEKEKKERIKDLRTYNWITKKIVFNRNFDSNIDLFKIPLYSWGTYVSERFKNKLIEDKVSDIGFAETKEELGKVWRPHFPIIEFEL